jgi:hypothetical protein
MTEPAAQARRRTVKHGRRKVQADMPTELKRICLCPRCLAEARKAARR